MRQAGNQQTVDLVHC